MPLACSVCATSDRDAVDVLWLRHVRLVLRFRRSMQLVLGYSAMQVVWLPAANLIMPFRWVCRGS